MMCFSCLSARQRAVLAVASQDHHQVRTVVLYQFDESVQRLGGAARINTINKRLLKIRLNKDI